MHFRNAFLAVSFNYASYCKCFHNNIHGLHGDTSAVAVAEVLLRHPPHHALSCQCLLFIRLGGQNEPSLSYFMFLASIQAVLQ